MWRAWPKRSTVFAEDEWREHPQKYAGNSAMVLISPHGEITDDMYGPMAVTEKLRRCPYLQQVLASFDTVFGRSRLMRLAPGAEVNMHNDVHYNWRNRVRIHVPIITEPAVQFFCGKESVHMAAGEAWIFDNWKPHRVINPGATHRIHLVADTVGTAAFWGLVRQLHLMGNKEMEPRNISYQPGLTPELRLENYNQPSVMPPAELNGALREMIVDLRLNRQVDPHQCGAFVQVLEELRYDWQANWVQHGPNESGWPVYRALLARARTRMAEFPRTLILEQHELPGAGCRRGHSGGLPWSCGERQGVVCPPRETFRRTALRSTGVHRRRTALRQHLAVRLAGSQPRTVDAGR